MKKPVILLSLLFFAAVTLGVAYSFEKSEESRMQSASQTATYVFSDLRRATVNDAEGRYVGIISDMIVNPDGRIHFALISPHGMVGTTERLVAFPFEALRVDKDTIVLNTTMDKVLSAPIFSRGYLSARSWDQDSYKYFGVQPQWSEENLQERRPAGKGQDLSMTQGWNRPYAASEILGTRVKNQQGEVLGKVDDLVFDNEGRISFAILGYGGFWGIGEKLVAVPITSLSYAEEPRHFALNTTKDNIQSAPLFSKKGLDDPEWADESYRYFGQQPYWTKDE